MLFDNNDKTGFDYSFLDLVNQNSKDINLYTSKEGFLRGNMFKDEYMPYKNYSYINISPKSEREAELFNVMQYEFAINDLNLYLDLNPNNEYVLNILKELIKLEKEEKEEYERKYGPLEVCNTNGNSFDWINSPWPWEKENGGSMYV